jgi:phenylacetic acid degradation operon negative regulatory protein
MPRAVRAAARRRSRSSPRSSPTTLRPQSVVFTLLAEHLLGHDRALFSGSFIEALARVGIGEHATRSTLDRMARRGLLARMRSGRKVYYRMTPRCTAILEDGRTRIWQSGAVNDEHPRTWTLLTFSMPESIRSKRHDLRARLAWSGFGPLQHGAWLAPSEVDTGPIVQQLGVAAHVRAFHVRPAPPSDPAEVIASLFDLDALAAGYRAFIARWKQPRARLAADPLALTLRLSTEWLRIIRDDPRVPLPLLPEGWPAIAAQHLFRELHGAQYGAAKRAAKELLDSIEV